jgi:uncharacterized protein YjbJ (UPF0337 family)
MPNWIPDRGGPERRTHLRHPSLNALFTKRHICKGLWRNRQCIRAIPPFKRDTLFILTEVVYMPKTDKGDKGKKDEAKGRVKQAAGALTGDDEMKREGQAEQKKGEAEKKLHDAKKKVKGDDR